MKPIHPQNENENGEGQGKPMRTQFLRRDFLSARIVDTGIAMQEQCGTLQAAGFLKDNFIAINVAMRVLLHPEQRRT